jgi:KUP system potassium uptake protein
VIKGLSPTYGARFVLDHGSVAFIALGSVVLAVTGAEALYADMGHFGRSPIRRAWFLLVFPALTLNYLAQGALILRSPRAVANPFFLLLPSWAQVPMVLLATVATVIASQSVISGAFSVTRQAVQLGFLPRVKFRQTSEHEIGQIYAPAINRGLFVAVVVLVLGFGSSVALASAYGVAVTGTFILNTILFLAVARLLWHRPKRLIALGAIVFLSIEVTFFAANLTKIFHGGWLPLVIASAVFVVLVTWRKGREIVTVNRAREEGPLGDFIRHLDARDFPVVRVPGTAVFLHANPRMTPAGHARQRRTQPCRAPERRHPLDQQRARSPHRRLQPAHIRRPRRPRRPNHMPHRPLRFPGRHRCSGHPALSGSPGPARGQLRLRQRDLLPLADHNHARRRPRHEQMAQAPIPHHGPQRSKSRRILQAP